MDEATKSVYEALNLKPREGGIQWGEPKEDPISVTDADPAETGLSQPAEQEADREVSQDPGEEPENEEVTPQEEPDNEPERQPLTREERTRNAARRRQAQERAAVENAVQAERDATNSRVKELLERAGFRDGDQPIENLDDLDRYLERMEETRIVRDLKDGKLEMKDLQSVVDRAVAKAQTPVQEPEQEPAQEPAQSEFVTQVAEELAEIHKLDPAIQTMDDLRKLERFEEFQDAVVNHNMNFLQAYRFVHADKLAQAQAQKAAAAQAQRLRNSTSGRDHMRPVNSRGSGAVPVSAEKAAAYRAVMPNMTNEEIRRAEDRARTRWGGKPSQ